MKITKITKCTRVPVFLMDEEEDVTVHFRIFSMYTLKFVYDKLQHKLQLTQI